MTPEELNGKSDDYINGWLDGRELARKEFEQAYNILSKHDTATMLSLLEAQAQLRNISLRRLAWSRIKDLFRSRHD